MFLVQYLRHVRSQTIQSAPNQHLALCYVSFFCAGQIIWPLNFPDAIHRPVHEFSHGLGHGVGISVHEAPPNLSKNEIAKTVIKNNMCFTIEPGLYNRDYFGVRLENSCYLKDGSINSFTNMCYEKKLIDFNLLTDNEKEWLSHFEVV